jgi:CubicO group peptidase (beta-lactamase class C family)
MQQMKQAALEKTMTDLEPNNRLGIMLLICGLLFYNLAVTDLAMAGEVWTPADEGIDVSRLDRVTALVDAYVEDKKVPGMTVMVSRNGRVIASVTRGARGLDNPEMLKPDDLFRIYSMTKAVTAVAALVLYEAGEFHLDDPVARYLPEFKEMGVFDGHAIRPAINEMMVRHLFTHMSGLSYGFRGEHPLSAMQQQLKLDQSADLTEFTQRLAQLPLRFEPGTEWGYSYASDVLGALIERISGQTLQAFMKSQVFEPLNMKDTSFSVAPDQAHRLTSMQAYNAESSELVVTYGPPFALPQRVTKFDSGGAGLFSTAQDYLNFLEMLRANGRFLDRQILSPKTVALMTRDHLPRAISDANIGPDHNPTLGLGAGHGLGIGVYIDPIRRGVLSSAGEIDWGGASGTVYWMDPVEQIIAVGLIQLFRSPHRFRDDLSVAIYQALSESYEP